VIGYRSPVIVPGHLLDFLWHSPLTPH